MRELTHAYAIYCFQLSNLYICRHRPTGNQSYSQFQTYTCEQLKRISFFPVRLQIPPPVICWNISPSMTHSYNCREAELIPIPRYSLRLVEKLGSCHAGEVRNNATKMSLANLINPENPCEIYRLACTKRKGWKI